MKKKYAFLNLKINPETKQMLRELAEKENRSMVNWVVTRIESEAYEQGILIEKRQH